MEYFTLSASAGDGVEPAVTMIAATNATRCISCPWSLVRCGVGPTLPFFFVGMIADRCRARRARRALTSVRTKSYRNTSNFGSNYLRGRLRPSRFRKGILVGAGEHLSGNRLSWHSYRACSRVSRLARLSVLARSAALPFLLQIGAIDPPHAQGSAVRAFATMTS
jgi:hypothetical protein